jgi:hypothetical protein
VKHCVASLVSPVPKDELAQLPDLVEVLEEVLERASRGGRTFTGD